MAIAILLFSTGTGTYASPFTVVLDPGHFNLDLDGKVTKDGAHAVVEGREVWEGEMTISVSEFLRKELADRGLTVCATRWLDPALDSDIASSHKYWRINSHGYDQELANIGRAEFANESILGQDWRSAIVDSSIEGKGLFIRIHFDASESASTSGFSVWYNNQSDYDNDGVIAGASKKWAVAIEAEMKKRWLIKSLGIKRFDRPIYGFKHAKVPSILIECGFMTNKNDLAIIMKQENRKLLADIIADVIETRDQKP